MDSIQLPGFVLAISAIGYLVVRLLLAAPASGSTPVKALEPDPLANDLASALPAFSDTKKELQQLLWTAGYYRPSALTEFLAIRAILFLGALIGTGLVAIFIEMQRIPMVVIIGLCISGLAFSAPRLILQYQAKSRARRLVRALPTGLDILGLSLTAGQNLLASLDYTSRELARPFPDLSEELGIVYQQASMHSLEQSLLHWAKRLEVPEIRSLSLLLIQSERLGTDMVKTLLEVADSQRILLRQKAEAQANRSNFWMLFPTLFCLWIASAIILVGPVYLEFWKYRRDQMNTLTRDARSIVERPGTVPRSTTNVVAQPTNQQAGSAPTPRP